jgi:hypothetical protein
MSERELPGDLHELVNEAVDIIEKGDYEKDEQTHVQRKYVTLGDDIEGSQIIRIHDEDIEKEIWRVETIGEIIDELNESDTYQKCLDKLDVDGNWVYENQEEIIERFLRRIIKETGGDVSDPEITNMISRLMSELENSPIFWNASSWLAGITSNNPVRLSESITLRPPTEDDLVKEVPKSAVVIGGGRRPDIAPSSILELTIQKTDALEVAKERSIALSTLQLFEVCSISEIEWFIESDPILKLYERNRFKVDRDKLGTTPFKTNISEDQNNDLRDFYGEISPRVRNEIFDNDESYLQIAFERYQNAISDDGSDESRLTSGIMALEALLLAKEGELSNKLSTRIGILLGYFEAYNSIEVKNKTLKGYEYRSEYVHGSNVNEDIEKLTERIVDYARKSLVVQLQLTEELGKSELINELDKASLHDKPKENLGTLIEDYCLMAGSDK